MDLALGNIVVVASAMPACGRPNASAHWAARVADTSLGEGHDWLDVNILGSHLPQMYRHAEITPMCRPADLAPHGFCMFCHGYGIVVRVAAPPEQVSCAVCDGRGRPLRLSFPDEACVRCLGSGVVARVDPHSQRVTCEVCDGRGRPVPVPFPVAACAQCREGFT